MSEQNHEGLRELIARYRREAIAAQNSKAAENFIGLAEELEFNLNAMRSSVTVAEPVFANSPDR